MKLTLNALFDYVNDDGIFTYLDSFDVPWKETVDADLLDLDYHSKHGTKIVSKTVTSLLTEDGLSSASKTKLAKLVYQKNKKRWDYLWESIGLYDDVQSPLDNTDWTETRVLGHQGADSRSQSIGAKSTTYTKGSQTNSETIGQSTLTEGQQNNITGQQTISMEEKKSAFNSNNYSPLDQKTEQLGQRSDTIGQKVNTDSGRSNSSTEGQRSDSTNEGAQSNSETGTNTFTDNETIARHGNIGITTPGQMIRDFRQTVNWQFFEIIYKDIDEMLVIEIYGKEDCDFDDFTIVTGYVLPIASASKLGGIKVGENLQIASDGTLSASGGGAGDVQSVNGKTGIVVLDASDVGATTSQDVSTAISTAVSALRQVPSGGNLNQVIRKLADGYGWSDANEVPSGGNLNQVLTKTADGYGWADSQGGGGGSVISVPYTLVHGYISVNNSGRANWTAYTGSEKTWNYVYDVSQYVGHWFEAYFIPNGMDKLINRERVAFLPDVDLTVTALDISGSWAVGASQEGAYRGMVVAPYGNYGWNEKTSANLSCMQYGFNYIKGIIPTGMKYLIIHAYSDPTTKSVYNDDIICACKILD